MAAGAALHRSVLTDSDALAADLAAWQREQSGWAVRVETDIEHVAAVWSRLEALGLESPGQSLAFTRFWIAAQRIPAADQRFVTAYLDGSPVALMALHRRRIKGARAFTWFPGPHVGCNAPLVDAGRLARLAPAQRAALWQAMAAALEGADLVYLKAVPALPVDGVDLFAELGVSLAADTLYRSAFSTWEECNTVQRSKSRRKHDRQQGERLEALGAVGFEELGPGEAAGAVLDTMFRQRAARFRQMGVPDPFAPAAVRAFYDSTVAPGSPLPVKLHLLRLDGAIVAIRYNIASGDKLFCLISSMSDDPAIQAGSPGKQCLLRVMQTVFEQGFRVFDMGAGFTDEKRHWCNQQIELRNHYLPLNGRGAAIGGLHRAWRQTRARIKASPVLREAVRRVRSAALRLRGGKDEVQA